MLTAKVFSREMTKPLQTAKVYSRETYTEQPTAKVNSKNFAVFFISRKFLAAKVSSLKVFVHFYVNLITVVATEQVNTGFQWLK